MAAPARSLLMALRAAGRGAHPLADVAAAAGLTQAQAQAAARALHRHRLIEAAQGGYQLTRAGWEATDPPPPAPPPPPPPAGPRGAAPGALVTRLWRALRMQRNATVPELLEMLELPPDTGSLATVRRYLTAWRSAGVTGYSRFKAPGRERKVPVHRLLTDLGPQAPVIRVVDGRRVLVDPNGGRVWDLSTTPATELGHG